MAPPCGSFVIRKSTYQYDWISIIISTFITSSYWYDHISMIIKERLITEIKLSHWRKTNDWVNMCASVNIYKSCWSDHIIMIISIWSLRYDPIFIFDMIITSNQAMLWLYYRVKVFEQYPLWPNQIWAIKEMDRRMHTYNMGFSAWFPKRECKAKPLIKPKKAYNTATC